MTNTELVQNRPARDLVDEVIGRIHRCEDAVTAYRAIIYLRHDLQYATAVTIKRLELELGGITQTTKALGITRQAITEIYNKTDVPGPRTDHNRGQLPTTRYGALLAACQAAARLADDARNSKSVTWMTILDKRLAQAEQSTETWPELRRFVFDTLLRRTTDDRADVIRSLIADLESAVVQLGSRHLTSREQGEVAIGYHQARMRG